jgi:uncharacterized protein YecT (DUF1311 family)
MINPLLKLKIYLNLLIVGWLNLLVFPIHAEEPVNNPIDSEEATCMERDSSTQGIVQCSNEAERKWDEELNRVYKSLQTQLDAQGQKSLKHSQFQWIKHRDAEFQAFTDIYGSMDGSMWQTIIASSRAELVKARVLALRNYLDIFEVNDIGAPMTSLSLGINSLCDESEKVIFSCQIKEKTLSICASQAIDELHYRFGTVDNIEMQLPEDTENSLESFHLSRKSNSVVLSVKNSKYTMENAEPVIYSTLYQVYSRADSKDGKRKTAGVVVILPAGKKNNFACTSQIVDNLTQIENIVPSE